MLLATRLFTESIIQNKVSWSLQIMLNKELTIYLKKLED